MDAGLIAIIEALLPLAIKYVPMLVDDIRAVIAGTHPDPAAVAAQLKDAIAARKSDVEKLEEDLAANDKAIDAEIVR